VKVSIIGTGYVGLVTGVCLAEKGHQVTCVEVDKEKVDKINAGVPPIYECGLKELLENNITLRLKATVDLKKSVLDTDITLITVGTPWNGREIDLTYIKDAADQVGKALKEKSNYHLVVVKSTVVPGTTDEVVLPILEAASAKKAGIDFGVGMNPEFLTEGEAVQDFLFPDRIILGGIDSRSIDTLDQLYAAFEGVQRLRTNNKTAEMIKYTSNALLATMISFSNEIGNLCSALGGVDVADVMRGIHSSKYLHATVTDEACAPAPIAAFLWSGCGFGGSCLPKDVNALIAHGKKAGRPMQLLEAVMRINEDQPRQVYALLDRHFASLNAVRIGVLGLAFRPGTSDVRESPAILIISELLSRGAKIKAYDPAANREAHKLLTNQNIVFCDNPAETLEGAEIVLLLTAWNEFQFLPNLLATLEQQPLIIDGRRMLDKHRIARYAGVGL
jgi:UDPglucose 6-dehydrogenase